MGRRTVVALLALLVFPVAAPARDFEHPRSHDTAQQFGPASVQRQDTPNDPNYDRAEADDEDGRSSSNFYDEDFRLFGFPSPDTPLARYTQGPHAGKPQIPGVNASGAWKATRGRADVDVAILDTGIRWDNEGLRTKIRLNRRELPLPERADGSHGASYDLDGDGVLTVDDYARDPRVGKARPTGEDLIRAFSDHTDADHNGYVDDIAGWDFFDDDNDPGDASSYFAARNHGTGRAAEAGERANDGQGSLGVCPRCRIVPIRIWDTFVSDGNTVGLGISYAARNGVEVVEAANGSLYHSRFTEAASRYAYLKGLAQTFSGNDLNTGNHNYPGNLSHAMLIQGTVSDTEGLGQNNEITSAFKLPIATTLQPRTFFRGGNTTQFGGKSSFSMVGSTGSQATGQASGAAALVISAAREAGVRLRADETREILEQTAEDVLPGNTQGTGTADPSQPGWDQHFGYGRANLGAAVSLAKSGKIPPQAAIWGPDWYAPLTGRTVTVTGLARARFASGGRYSWKLEWGPGLEPAAGQWRTLRSGAGTKARTSFGTLPLAAIRAELARRRTPQDPAGPVLPGDVPDPYQHQFTVRLTVSGAGVPTAGVDRRAFTTFTDPSLVRGRPKRMGTGGEAALRYADVDGDNADELVVPLEDGTVHVYNDNGREVRGFPVRTRIMNVARKHRAALRRAKLPPPRDPLRAPAIGDLDGDGKLEIAATAGTRLYVWEPNGKLRRGFPRAVDPKRCGPAWEDQQTKRRKCGFIGSPAIARLDGPARPPVLVAAALDGNVYAWTARGRLVKGFPIELADPGKPAAERQHAESIGSPAIGDLDGDGRDDIVVASNEAYGAEQSPGDVQGGIAGGMSAILAGAAGGSSRLYAISGRTKAFLPGWPAKLNGAIQTTLPLIGPGHDAALAKIDGAPRVIASTTGGSLSELGADGRLVRSMQQSVYGPGSNATDRTGQLNLFEYASVGKLDGRLSVVKYGVSLGQAANLVLSGQNAPYNHLIGAYAAGTGAPLPRWPTVTDDYQFLSASTIARVGKGAGAQVLAGTGLGLLHAYDGATGHDVAGFPKQTGGWLYSPAALAAGGRLAAITREGYLFQWRTRAPKCQGEWPSYRHDAHGTGNYDRDGAPPAKPGKVRVAKRAKSYRISFLAPGDDRYCGAATGYRVRIDGKLRRVKVPKAAGGKRVAIVVRRTTRVRRLSVQAVDDARNGGRPLKLRLAKR